MRAAIRAPLRVLPTRHRPRLPRAAGKIRLRCEAGDSVLETASPVEWRRSLARFARSARVPFVTQANSVSCATATRNTRRSGTVCPIPPPMTAQLPDARMIDSYGLLLATSVIGRDSSNLRPPLSRPANQRCALRANGTVRQLECAAMQSRCNLREVAKSALDVGECRLPGRLSREFRSALTAGWDFARGCPSAAHAVAEGPPRNRSMSGGAEHHGAALGTHSTARVRRNTSTSASQPHGPRDHSRRGSDVIRLGRPNFLV